MLSCRITQLRRSVGINQFQLAEELHLSPSAIGMYEQGRRTPNIDVLIQLSKIFNVSLDYLITGSEYTPHSEARTLSAPPTSTPCSCQNCCCQQILDILLENMSPNQQR